MISFENLNLKKHAADDITEIKNTFYQQGFALIDTSSIHEKDKITPIAEALKLGDVATTNYNKKYFNYKLTTNNHSVIGNLPKRQSMIKHEGFESNNSQGLHVDGTFEPLGTIQTSLLYCSQPAKSGGESILFNLIGAVHKLAQMDMQLIEPLFDENAFKRESTYEGVNESYTGPILGYHKETKRLICRFAINETCRWEEGFYKVPGLKKSVEQLLNMAKEGSPYMAKFLLDKGTLIVMDNHRICHGRASYSDCTESPRTMIRGVYSQLPN